jgi:GT2 family glycosyltransferase
MLNSQRFQIISLEEASNANVRLEVDFLVFVESASCLRSGFEEILTQSLPSPDSLVLAYGDETISLANRRIRTWKPTWSPERLRGQYYVGLPVILSKRLFDQCGGWTAEFGSLAIYDLVLRASEIAEQIVFIPEVLHDTNHPVIDITSTSSQYLDVIQNIVQNHLDRTEPQAVATTTHPLTTTVNRSILSKPLVSIIIPTCGTTARIHGKDSVLIEDCINSILSISSYDNFEIVVVFDSHTPQRVIHDIAGRNLPNIKLVEYSRPFNFSEKINLGAVKSSGEVLLLLNDDTEILSSNWIEEHLTYLEQDDVAMVGPMLLLADGRIQSAGHFNFETGAIHVAAGHSADIDTYDRILSVPAERSGLTMACTAIKKSVFNQVGGLCTLFPKAFNDVDFGNKVRLLGYRIIWTPRAKVAHYESLSRDPKTERFESKLVLERWANECTSHDPYLPAISYRLVDVYPSDLLETYTDFDLFVD